MGLSKNFVFWAKSVRFLLFFVHYWAIHIQIKNMWFCDKNYAKFTVRKIFISETAS